MKRFIFAVSICLLAPSAFADDVKSEPKPTCGTVAECQKKVDDQSAQIAQLQAAYQAVHQQRDQAQSALFDAQVSAFLAAKK